MFVTILFFFTRCYSMTFSKIPYILVVVFYSFILSGLFTFFFFPRFCFVSPGKSGPEMWNVLLCVARIERSRIRYCSKSVRERDTDNVHRMLSNGQSINIRVFYFFQ